MLNELLNQQLSLRCSIKTEFAIHEYDVLKAHGTTSIKNARIFYNYIAPKRVVKVSGPTLKNDESRTFISDNLRPQFQGRGKGRFPNRSVAKELVFWRLKIVWMVYQKSYFMFTGLVKFNAKRIVNSLV